MTTERRRQIESVCLRALTRDATERAAFVDAACADDAELRREVQSMLAGQPDVRTFLETPAWDAPAAPLAPGTRLGPYEIHTLIGAGGMGVVYKARDTRLDRTVAIKVLPPAVAADPVRRARFEVEAKTIAGLSHSHICTLHDVGDHDGSMFLVMEHLAGETLAERLRRGPLPPQQALATAAEIADALSVAHRQGVVHRDLKPGNVMLTKSGAKLLDFGLAKLKRTAVASSTVSRSSGGGEPQTEAGSVLGTVPYMAPEQIEGKEADARSDIFSFGAVLYEMVAGKRPFEGENHASVAAAILEREPPPLSSLQPQTPPILDRLVRQCLAKSPDDRPDSARDVANDLRWLRDASDAGSSARADRRRWSALRASVTMASLLAAAIVGAGVMWLLRPSSPRPLVRSLLDVRPAEELNAGSSLPGRESRTPGGSQTALGWTPDGRALVFVGRRGGVQQLYRRPLNGEASPISSTVGARVPALSPDGQWVAFWTNDEIRKVRLDGGPSTGLVLVRTEPPWGMAWGEGGRLFFGDTATASIWQRSAEGKRERVSEPRQGELRHCLPWPLPGGRTILYTVKKGLYSWGGEEIVAQNLVTGTRTTVLREAADARYVASGHLVFLRRGRLFALPFDPERVEPTGVEVPVLDNVAQALIGPSGDVTGAGQWAVSAGGNLAWITSPVASYPESSLVALDRRGRISRLPTPVGPYVAAVRLSPDERRLAVGISDLSERSLWVYDIHRPSLAPTRLSRGDEVIWPAWSPDGRDIAFLWLKDGRFSLATQPADGSALPRVLVAGRPLSPSSVSRDGNVLAVRGLDGIVMATGDGSVRAVIDTPDQEKWPEVSRDGRWLAYGSNASGRMEIYDRSYPIEGAADAERVSVDGGESPAWHPNGRELFFLAGPTASGAWQMMAVDFSPGAQPRAGRPRVLFEFDGARLRLNGMPIRNYQVGSDGRFYGIEERTPSPGGAVLHINLIQNWLEELKQKAPPAR